MGVLVLLIVAVLVLLYLWKIRADVSDEPTSTDEFIGGTPTGPLLNAFTETTSNDRPKSIEKFSTFKETGEILQRQGMENADWNEVMLASSVEPAVFASHRDYVKDVRKFSSGPGFTSVDDGVLGNFNNFVGFFRPQYVPEGSSARSVSGTDPAVNKRWTHVRFG